MKKTLKILVAIVLGLSFMLSAKAESYTVSEVSGTLSIGGSCAGCYKQKDGLLTNSFVTSPYSVNYGGGSYAAYCLDPNSPDEATMTVKAVINGNTTSRYHAGLFAIATSDKAYFNNNMSAGVDKYAYSSTNLALRMWKVAFGYGEFGNNSYGGTKAYVRAIGKTAANIMAENANLANAATGYNCSTAECFYKKLGLGSSYKDVSAIYGQAAKDVLPTAKALFIVGLNGAANTSASTGSSTGISSSLTKSTSVPVAKSDTATHFVQKDYYDINVTNFTSENYVSGVTLTCENCNTLTSKPTTTISRYSLDNGKTWSDGAPTDAILKSVTGTTKIVIEVTTSIKRNSGYKCDDVKVSLSYKYYAPTSDKSVLLLEPSTSKNGQDFVAIIPNGSDSSNNVPVKESFNINLCGDNYCEYYDPEDIENMTDEEFEDYTEECCTDLETLCDDKTNPANEEYCEIYSEYCGACDTEIVVPSVCTYIEGEEGEAVAEDMTGYIKSAIDEDGKENIKACLLRRKKDEAGHTYKALDNSYCQVFCKEDYGFDLPTAVSLNSGTYFQLEATISGTKTCYTSEIDVDKFKNDISALDPNSDAYKQKVSEYNACVNMEVDYECFDPVIEYEYEEIYNDQLGENNKFVQNGELVETNKKTTYCNSDINDDYSCQGAATTTASKITVNGKEFNSAKYVKSTITKTGNYKTPSVFYNQRPTGTITTDSNAENAVLIDGLPVSINTDKGRHKFTLSLKNIGEYYDKTACEAGRLIGDENSVYDKQNKDKNVTGKYVAEYQCYYDVNCPECEGTCEGPLCDIEICDGVNCEPTCLGLGCAYDTNAGLSYAYRTVTLNNLNTSNRQLGYNWDANNSVKAKETIAEIEATGEAAYEEAEYSFTLTPALITAIKEYNKSQLENGGYANDTLTCSDDKYGNAKVNCESDFIAQLVSGDIGNSSNQITVPESDKKFTSWLDSDYCNGTCTITKGSGIGPSWK